MISHNTDPLGNDGPNLPGTAQEVGFSDLEPDMDLLLDPLRDFDTDEERW